MTSTIRVLLAGEGAIAGTHAKILNRMHDVEIACLAGGVEANAKAFADHWVIPEVTLDYPSRVMRDDIDAVILAAWSWRVDEESEPWVILRQWLVG